MLIIDKLMKKYFVSNTTPETLLNEAGQPYSCPFAAPIVARHPISGEIQQMMKACTADCMFYDSDTNTLTDNDMLALAFDKTVTLHCCHTEIHANILQP